MNISIPSAYGIEATRHWVATNPDVKVLARSSRRDSQTLQQTLRAGACGYIVKSAPDDELLRGIRAVAKGCSYLCSDAVALIVNTLHDKAPAKIPNAASKALTKRERQVLILVAKGYSSANIAQELGVSLGTIEAHRRNLLRKLKRHMATDLIHYAMLGDRHRERRC